MITDQMLAEASAELNSAMLSSLPDPSPYTHQFSPEFERKMRRVLRKEKHPVRYRAVRRAAAFLLVLLLSFMTLLAVSPSVRAAVIGWIRKQYDYFAQYSLSGEILQDDQSECYALCNLPAEYEERERIETPGNTAILYENTGTRQLLYFSYSKDPGSVTYFIKCRGYTLEEITINEKTYEFYRAESPDHANVILWSDGKTNTFFCISAFADKNELIKFSENIKKTEK